MHARLSLPHIPATFMKLFFYRPVTLLLLVVVLLPLAVQAESITLDSPDEQFSINFSTGDADRPTYSVRWKGREIIAPSGLGFLLVGEINWSSGFESITAISRSESDSTWKPVWGERASIPDRYRSVTVLYRRQNPPAEMKIEARAYDEGVAFRYIIESGPDDEKVNISSELTEFRFNADHDLWAVTSAQGKYLKVKLSQTRHSLERPCVLETGDGKVIAIAEAALVDYARMRVRRSETEQHTLVSRLHGPVVSKLPMTTPWRVIMAGDTAGELLENNYLILNLNEPSQIEDTSWIRPGKVIREVSLTTEGGKARVDFAVKYGLQYI